MNHLFLLQQAHKKHGPAGLLYSIIIVAFLSSCASSTAKPENAGQPAAVLPVLKVAAVPATTFREYNATVEGKVNVEIRPQVDGYLDKIFVDEGAYVKAGQPLFRINDRTYQEQLSNASALLLAAQANEEKALVEVNRLTPLVQNNVVSDVQLKTATAAYQAAKASVAQAQANVGNARINVGYTLITAPVNGYIGRIPFKTGSLVGRGETQPLTLLSDVNEVYAYFSMSEIDFLKFKNKIAGNTIADKVKQLPAVDLVLPDNSIYTEKGHVETMEGQFDKTMGAVSFRASFPNGAGLLRSGNTGKVRIPEQLSAALLVPQEATFELQDKIFVFTVGDSNKVASKPITISGKNGAYYFVEKGLQAGESIVYAGLGRLQDGAVITPQPMSMDSLLKVKPL
ncbi:efflux RND transporter periplasmic adaptor subunit [Chitinophaga sancti]|uniref:Efflux RND transporter periplasmic adaptor subunit n=1 Tax=Chitinophaga sancti TaxID=1004 RepID=A0A1K1M4J4_9BACT|nr:efflux RND transporter periplasmic adaptor subunit [Chitinophaga sancti]WQD64640.1 efflux RND transporter periplasmic adaptor subunit [Chitinophaga sancti]WQG89737.1 efflux RND transporter periplasmic adaptor subunit [Chitinophaga sancti]SFW17991.1 membrane fusion protein, multidrug efflux system [Chitinophaga sancti]